MNAQQKEILKKAWITNIRASDRDNFAYFQSGTARPQPERGLSCRQLEELNMIGVYATGDNPKLLRIAPI